MHTDSDLGLVFLPTPMHSDLGADLPVPTHSDLGADLPAPTHSDFSLVFFPQSWQPCPYTHTPILTLVLTSPPLHTHRFWPWCWPPHPYTHTHWFWPCADLPTPTHTDSDLDADLPAPIYTDFDLGADLPAPTHTLILTLVSSSSPVLTSTRSGRSMMGLKSTMGSYSSTTSSSFPPGDLAGEDDCEKSGWVLAWKPVAPSLVCLGDKEYTTMSPTGDHQSKLFFM